MFLFLLIQGEIVREKEYRLRLGLIIIGISNTMYWLSWIITSFILTLFLSVYTIIVGYIFAFPFFTNTNFLVLLMMFLYFTMAMQFLSLFISTLVSSLNSSNSVSYAFVLFSVVIELFISSPGLMAVLYKNNLPGWVTYFIHIMYIYPPFNYSKVNFH